ncbi:MAG: YceI family protein [Planctomycetes bacterium]|nr:YceI family protein [Planctomycetota bacterium]
MKILLLLPFSLALFALPAEPTAAHADAAPRGEHDWVVDPVHSSVVFRVKHANAAWFKGTFDKIEGAVHLDPAQPEAGKVELTIPVDSVDTNDKKRDDHLKAADFFHHKENPEITFRSTKIARQGEALAVTGELALAGKTRTITIPVEKVGEGEFYGKRIGYTTTFTIRRTDYGMTYGVDKNALGDEVTLMIDLELVQAK